MSEETKEEKKGLNRLKGRHAIFLDCLWLIAFSTWTVFYDGGADQWWYWIVAVFGSIVPWCFVEQDFFDWLNGC